MPTKKQRKPRKKMPLRYVADTRIKERPLAFVDLEFSGLGADNEILQIGVVLVSQPEFQVIGEWQAKVHPRHIENADRKALKLIGYSAKKWKDALTLRDALEQFNAFVDDAVLIGYNVVGDFYQLKKSFHQVGVTPAYHWQVLDVLSMIYAELYRSGLDGFRMREVVRYFRLKSDESWHDALVDARATFKIFCKLMDRMHDERA
jgi:DNA polymerase III alpha subunit (gram-positive type)